ncbi:16726_t:CDS:2, partial [Racocetra fulgida]
MSINIVNASIEKLVLNITKKQKQALSNDQYGYNRLAEKFRIHAQGTKAEFLEKYVSSLMQRPTVEGSIQPDQPRFKVSDILNEEPLTGPHWIIKTDYNEDDDDDDGDWDFDVQEWIRARLGDRATNFQNGRNQNLIPEASHNVVQKDDVEEIPDQDLNYEIVQELLSNQYWRPNYCNQSHLFAPSLAQYRSQDKRYLFYDPTRLKYITELDAIREVLFMLSGRPSFLFCKDTNGKFQVQLNAILMHLTEGGFKALLEYFCEHGNFLAKLRIVATRICTESRPTYGQTAQAFAASILKMVWKFDTLLAGIESKYRINNSVSQ